MRFLIPTILAIAFGLVPEAYAQNVSGTATAVGGALTNVVAGTEFGTIATNIALKSLPFLNGFAILTIVIAGVLAVVAQDENRIENAKHTVIGAIIAIVLINTAGAIAGGFVIAFSELMVTFAYKKVAAYLLPYNLVPDGLLHLLSTDY